MCLRHSERKTQYLCAQYAHDQQLLKSPFSTPEKFWRQTWGFATLLYVQKTKWLCKIGFAQNKTYPTRNGADRCFGRCPTTSVKQYPGGREYGPLDPTAGGNRKNENPKNFCACYGHGLLVWYFDPLKIVKTGAYSRGYKMFHRATLGKIDF